MSGSALQRRPATVAFVVALVGVLILLASGVRASADPVVLGADVSGAIAVTKTVVHHAAQRAATPFGHVKAAALGASQRTESDAAGVRVLIVVLLAWTVLTNVGRHPPPRRPAGTPGVRAPPRAAGHVA